MQEYDGILEEFSKNRDVLSGLPLMDAFYEKWDNFVLSSVE